MSKYKVKILKKIVLREPDDYRNSWTGGDYREVLYKCVLVGGKKKLKFDLYESSFEGDFCELTGRYTDTAGVSVFEEDIEEITNLYYDDFEEYLRRRIVSFYVSKSIVYRLFDDDRIRANHVDINLDEFEDLIKYTQGKRR